MGKNNSRDSKRDAVNTAITTGGGFQFRPTSVSGGATFSSPVASRGGSAAPAADPIRAASSLQAFTPGRVVARSAPGEVPRSLSEQVSAGYYEGPSIGSEVRQGDSPSRTGQRQTIRQSSLSVSAGNSPAPSRSPEKVRENPTCKPRPKSNKPKGGGGSGKRFVPWCD